MLSDLQLFPRFSIGLNSILSALFSVSETSLEFKFVVRLKKSIFSFLGFLLDELSQYDILKDR